MEKQILYSGKTVTVGCDEKCDKAWGLNGRPKMQLSDEEDDYAFLSDDELGVAPENPGTSEGGECKPVNQTEIPNKWCVRQCERCVFAENGKLNLPDFSKRIYNQPWKHAEYAA